MNGREQGKRGDPDAPTLHRRNFRAQSPREGVQRQTTVRITQHENNAGGQLSESPTFDYRFFFFAVFFTISQTKQSNNIVKYSIYPQTLEIKNILI